ncbi:MAG: hypothetical protein M3137_14930 [Actinomycetota bacterium]|nr:hypothetical protein [Actinomycetota bacterium]
MTLRSGRWSKYASGRCGMARPVRRRALNVGITFQREGIARHAQFRAGQWHDLVIFSRIRQDRLI